MPLQSHLLFHHNNNLSKSLDKIIHLCILGNRLKKEKEKALVFPNFGNSKKGEKKMACKGKECKKCKACCQHREYKPCEACVCRYSGGGPCEHCRFEGL